MKAREIVRAVLERNVAGLSLPDEKFDVELKALGLDSLDNMVVMLEIQEESGVTIPEEAVDHLTTPAQIVRYIEEHA